MGAAILHSISSIFKLSSSTLSDHDLTQLNAELAFIEEYNEHGEINLRTVDTD